MTVKDRFFSKVNKDTISECWNWTGAKTNGYGYLYHEGKVKRATHVSLFLVGREIEAGKIALHKCDNPSCVNPDHLVLGTQKDNMQDMSTKRRSGARRYPDKYKDCKPPVMIGEENPACVLSEDDVRIIRELYDNKILKQVELAKRFGISQAMISLIVRREKWKHVV